MNKSGSRILEEHLFAMVDARSGYNILGQKTLKKEITCIA
jgi:hypothetical protein